MPHCFFCDDLGVKKVVYNNCIVKACDKHSKGKIEWVWHIRSDWERDLRRGMEEETKLFNEGRI